MIRISYIIFFTLILSCKDIQSNSNFPIFWSSEYLFSNHALKFWEKLSDNDRLNFEKVYKLLGEKYSSDGDSEFKAALMIYCTNEDPYNYLLTNIKSNDLNRKIYALGIISHLKDRRFNSILKELLEVKIEVKDHFWGKNLNEITYYVLNRLKEVDDLNSEELKKYAASWLIESWNLKLQN